MKLYKIINTHDQTSFIAANSFGEAEALYEKKVGSGRISVIQLIVNHLITQ